MTSNSPVDIVKVFDCQEPQQLLDAVSKLSGPKLDNLFRGQRDADFDLIPSALRNTGELTLKSIFASFPPQIANYEIKKDSDRLIAEFFALAIFYKKSNGQGLPLPPLDQRAHEILVAGLRQPNAILELEKEFFGHQLWPRNRFEQVLGLAQHYGIPTRLLDWSEDFLVACYFAAKDAADQSEQSDSNSKLAIWIVDSYQMTNLHLMSDENKNIVSGTKLVYCPYHGNPNLAAQRGVFSLVVRRCENPAVLTSVEKFSVVEVLSSLNNLLPPATKKDLFHNKGIPLLVKVTLPTKRAPELLKLLADIGYDHSRLFPGYAGCATSIHETIRWK